MPKTDTAHHTLSGTALKWLAVISMLVDHIGASCLEAGVLSSTLVLRLADGGWGIYRLDRIMRLFGRLAFPIYCFLLVEGFLHTHDLRAYIRRMLIFAIISEIPFDWAFFRTPFYWGHQNVYWTLLFGLCGMACLRKFSDEETSRRWLWVAGTLGCVIIAGVMRTDYDVTGVLIILVLYLLREHRTRQCLAGALMTAYEITAPIAFIPVWFYSGERGYCPRYIARFFYIFYPAHLLVLGCITNLLLH